jgi:hypothetical protein
LAQFLSSTIEALPEDSELHDTFSQYLEDLETLTAEAEKATPATVEMTRQQKTLMSNFTSVITDFTSPKSTEKLTSQFEIESRIGFRPTQRSQKVRQELDRAKMTSKDEEYTNLVKTINQFLQDLFT